MSNFKESNHFLKFNQALCYMFLGEFEKAINIYRKLLTYPGEYFKRNVLHNLIICSEICGQPCKEVMFHLKENHFLQVKYTKDLTHIMFQKLVAFMKQNYSKFEIADLKATADKATEEEQQIVSKEVKHPVLSPKQQNPQPAQVEPSPALAFEPHFKLNVWKERKSI
jgi:tetratricopeptide (TPR) repeat protein